MLAGFFLQFQLPKARNMFCVTAIHPLKNLPFSAVYIIKNLPFSAIKSCNSLKKCIFAAD